MGHRTGTTVEEFTRIIVEFHGNYMTNCTYVHQTLVANVANSTP